MPPCCQSNFFGCLWGGIASPNMHLVLLLYLIFRLLPVFLELCSLLLLLRVVFVVSVCVRAGDGHDDGNAAVAAAATAAGDGHDDGW